MIKYCPENGGTSATHMPGEPSADGLQFCRLCGTILGSRADRVWANQGFVSVWSESPLHAYPCLSGPIAGPDANNPGCWQTGYRAPVVPWELQRAWILGSSKIRYMFHQAVTGPPQRGGGFTDSQWETTRAQYAKETLVARFLLVIGLAVGVLILDSVLGRL